MPDDKFSNLSQADEMVPMDTEGGEVEVALPEETTDEPAAVVQEVQEEAQPEVSAAEQEQEEYSKGVQKRIDKLTAKLREAERREQAATEFANNVKQENDNLKTKTPRS
jgi:dsDNA-specific endonuclease/ATPase MutS2